MDIIKRVKSLCTSGKYYRNIVAVTLQITPVIGHIDVRHYDVGNDAIVGELFDRSISGWNIYRAEMFYERGEFRLVLFLMETADKSSNISDEVIEVISNLPRRY